MMNKIKKMSISELREKGYLQELNRRFLHPLGLALEVIVNDDGTEELGGIWDYRDDDEGIYYGLSKSEGDRIARFEKNARFIDEEIEKRSNARKTLFGDVIEPIPTNK